MLTTRRIRALILVTAVLALGGAAAPASADDGGAKTAACWVDADRGVTQCFTSVGAMQDAVRTQTGGTLVRQTSALARPAGVLAVYVIADLYTNASYGGTITSITSSSSTICTTGTGKLGNLSGMSNNSTSSVKSYLGCVTTLYDGTGQTGTSYGPVVNAAGVGAFNDLASSYNIN
jgi:hypothetical protein